MALISQTASLYYAARKTQILHVAGNLDGGQKRWRSVIVNARPPSEAAAVSTDPLTKEDLIGYFASGCKPKENWRIGIEHERFGFDLKTLRPMKYEQIAELLNGIAERFGWDKIFEGYNVIALKQGNQSIALEPGGQFEHSGAPLETLHQIHAEVDSHLYQVQSVLKEIGIGLLDIGYQPKWEIKDIPLMPKKRYQVFLNYMPKVGSRGIDSLFRTCSVQVNLDFSSETDMIRKLRASLALQPIATALFANSPFTEGKPSGFLCTRSEIYTDVDKDRTGMLPFVFHDSFGFERYVDYALDIPMYFVYRNKNYFDCTDMTFREFMAGKRCCIPGEVIPTISDWEMHLGTIYPEVRLRKYLEMRGAGSGPWKAFCGLPAFWVSRQKKLMRYRKKLEEKSEEKSLQDFYGTWPSSRTPCGHFENQLEGFMVESSPSTAPKQKRLLQGPEPSPYQHIPNQCAAQSMYGNLTNPSTHVSSHIQPGKFKHQNLFSGCEVSSGNANAINKSVDTSAKPLTMSPQEKIEKLRRRQQLQAMLAIQKQQQQFSHQISSTHQSSTQKGPQENQIQYFERADLEVEGLSTLPSLDPNSTVEQDDSSIVSAAIDDHSAEDTILYRLQYIISKLDIKIRLCIRDSLYRLAQSAMRRHYASDTSSSNKSSKVEGEVFAEEINNHNRFGKIPDLETETNPIDRTVAHLLFHRPLNSSGKKSDASESPISTKLSCEHKTAGLVNLSNECFPDSLKNKQCFPRQGSESCRPFPEPSSVDPFKTSPLVGNSENASSTGPDDGGTMEVEASL
ncbi:hypothetical protein DVH24_015960 [Malus domestica]|uniref:Glutamate--cysteine ligase, chloroplastic n=1 Tax=Malus domestica TaxID=3750 RepID=A0A498JJE5_MALDO|nr:hypothetical protein DVH24_015960 [Malus domestica]